MDNLAVILEQTKDKIKRFRALYEQNEQAVREQIVATILKSLKWNTENPEEVQPNVFTDEGFPDYTLLKDEKKVLLIEVKKLSVDIEQKEIIRQLAKYLFNEGVKYGILTNGSIWILIRSFEEGTSLNERIVWKIDLENEEISSFIRQIISIERTNIDNLEILVKKVQILDEIWQTLLDDSEEMAKGLIPIVKSLINQSYPEYQFQETEITDFLKEKIKEITIEEEPTSFQTVSEVLQSIKYPKKMKLKNETFELNNSYEVLINTANWLIKIGKLRPSDCPISIGRGKRYLINKEPRHKYGDPFVSPKKLSNGLYIETHASSATNINYSKRLLEKFGISPDILSIE